MSNSNYSDEDHSRWRALIVASFSVLLLLVTLPATLAAQEVEPADAIEIQQQDVEYIKKSDDDGEVELEEGERFAAVAVNGFGVAPAKMIAAKKFILAQSFSAEIELVDHICKLDKKQLFKLQVGAKGATKKLTKRWRKTVGAQFGIKDEIEVPKTSKEMVIKDADEIDQNTIQIVTMNLGNPFISKPPTDDEFWQKTLQATLTETQRDTLKNYRDKRTAAKRSALIASTVESLAFEINLRQDQVAKFSKLVTSEMEKSTAKSSTMYESFVLYYVASKTPSSDLEKLLTPSQMQKWKITMAPTQQYAMMIEGQNQ